MGGVIIMRYSSILTDDVANGDGVGVSLYLQGCSHRCLGCFNPETWDFNSGLEFDTKVEQKILGCLSKPQINHLSILGGEPLEKENWYPLSCFIQKVRYSFPHIKIWLWTGFTWEGLQEIIRTFDYVKYLEYILENVDYIIDGPFIQEKKDLTLLWRGSSNQRIIESSRSIKYNKEHFTDFCFLKENC